MATRYHIDWTDIPAAAKQLAGNWRKFECFAWHRAHDLEDAGQWMIWYTSHRDARLLEQSNEQALNKRLYPFSEGDDPDLVFERHSSWLVGHLDGFSLRVFKADGTATLAFEEFCALNEAMERYPILDEQDYSEREYAATLENYANEMWRARKDLPEGWESEVFGWFNDNGLDQFTESRDDQGGWADRQNIIEALQDLGLLPALIGEN